MLHATPVASLATRPPAYSEISLVLYYRASLQTKGRRQPV